MMTAPSLWKICAADTTTDDCRRHPERYEFVVETETYLIWVNILFKRISNIKSGSGTKFIF